MRYLLFSCLAQLLMLCVNRLYNTDRSNYNCDEDKSFIIPPTGCAKRFHCIFSYCLLRKIVLNSQSAIKPAKQIQVISILKAGIVSVGSGRKLTPDSIYRS